MVALLRSVVVPVVEASVVAVAPALQPTTIRAQPAEVGASQAVAVLAAPIAERMAELVAAADTAQVVVAAAVLQGTPSQFWDLPVAAVAVAAVV